MNNSDNMDQFRQYLKIWVKLDNSVNIRHFGQNCTVQTKTDKKRQKMTKMDISNNI